MPVCTPTMELAMIRMIYSFPFAYTVFIFCRYIKGIALGAYMITNPILQVDKDLIIPITPAVHINLDLIELIQLYLHLTGIISSIFYGNL